MASALIIMMMIKEEHLCSRLRGRSMYFDIKRKEVEKRCQVRKMRKGSIWPTAEPGQTARLHHLHIRQTNR
jgi:hypothetical protein